MVEPTVSASISETATTAATLGSNNLQRILASFQQQMLRMDDLEAKMEAQTAATRRRIANLLMQQQHQQDAHVASPFNSNNTMGASMHWPVRQSHLRMWVTHLHEPSKTTTTNTTSAGGGDYIHNENRSTSPQTTTIPENFTLQIEGKLLIGHLDHASAKQFDNKIGYTPPTDDNLDRNKVDGREDEEAALPEPQLTHLFERVSVTFQTVYQPKIHPMARILPSSSLSSPAVSSGSKATKKSSRRSSTSHAAGATSTTASSSSPASGHASAPLKQDPDQVDFRKCFLSKRQTMTWTHGNNSMTMEGAQAWAFHYTPPAPSSGAYQVHSVICHIELVPRRWSSEDRYVILSPLLAEHLFPHHPAVTSTSGGEEAREKGDSEAQVPSQAAASAIDSKTATAVSSSSKKRKADEVSEVTADGHPFPPVDPEIHIPVAPLFLSEILQAFHVYIHDNSLVDPEERSTVLVSKDDMLQQLLSSGDSVIERLPYSELLNTLLRAKAIAPEGSLTSTTKQYTRAPVEATYIMRQDTAWKDSSENEGDGISSKTTDRQDKATTTPALWQWDMECSVPLLFPFRARELLRRVKRRELEYTSSRTKARYLLQSQQPRTMKEEDAMQRQQIEAVVANKSLAPVLQPVMHTLARGAATAASAAAGGSDNKDNHHTTTEAQRICLLDQQISYLLLEQLPGHCRAAQEARELLATCLELGKP